MERHGVERPYFKGFMADNAHANWNAARIVYGNGKKEGRMEDRERFCQFHWIQSMIKYTDKQIAENMREQHVKMCHQYRTARKLAEAESLYHGLRAWWVSAGAMIEKTLMLWLAFWHFRYCQWGGFMTGVSSFDFCHEHQPGI